MLSIPLKCSRENPNAGFSRTLSALTPERRTR